MDFDSRHMRQEVTTDETAAALLRVASYLGRPQKFMPVGDARAEMRRTLELVAKGSVVLTTHGEPAAAVVPFTTLEDMRRALLHLLVEEMGSSLERSQERARSQKRDVPATSEEELEALVGDTVKKARRRNGKSSRKVSRG
jgi:antitoxin (DNA-binding transcriptional repressor) of toxin-antitoxin stability system